MQHWGLHKYSCGSESSAGVNWPRWNDTNLSWLWPTPNTCERERSGRSIGLSVTICKHETNTKTNTMLYLSPGLAKHLDVCRVLFYSYKCFDLIKAVFIKWQQELQQIGGFFLIEKIFIKFVDSWKKKIRCASKVFFESKIYSGASTLLPDNSHFPGDCGGTQPAVRALWALLDMNNQHHCQLCHSPPLPGHGPCWAWHWSINSFCGTTWDLPHCCGAGAASEPGYPHQAWSWPAGWLHGLGLDSSPELVQCLLA